MLPVYRVTSYAGDTVRYLLSKKAAEKLIDKASVEGYSTAWDSAAMSFENNYFEISRGKSEIDYKTGWIKYNLKQFYKEERISQCFFALGGLSLCAYAVSSNKPSFFSIAGVVLGGVGFGLHLDAYKWIKRATIETKLNGVSLNIKF